MRENTAVTETKDFLERPLQTMYSFYNLAYLPKWRRGSLIVSALDSGSGGPGSSPGQGYCVVFLGKTLCTPGVQMGISKCAGGNPAMD